MEFDGARFELSITPNYVSNWGFKEAVRELIQNGIDSETTNPDGLFYIQYIENDDTLYFVNENTSIPISSLLLGKTTKSKDKRTVGQFGEGYKIAALVLSRLGHSFKIYNGSTNKIWSAVIEKSQSFDGEDVLVFKIADSSGYYDDDIFGKNDFAIVVDNVTREEYGDIEDIWLNFFEDYKSYFDRIETKYGDIISNEGYAGKIYVNGIFIQEDKTLKYCYNFKPEFIQLERDRAACDWYSLRMATANMTAQAVLSGDIDIDDFISMFKNGNSDVYFSNCVADKDDIINKILEEFDKNNPNSIPVDNQDRLDLVKRLGGKPVLIPSNLFSYIKESAESRIEKLMNDRGDDVEVTLYDDFWNWYLKHINEMSYVAKKEFKELMVRLKDAGF